MILDALRDRVAGWAEAKEAIFQMSDDSGTSFSRVKKDVMVY